MAASLSPPSRPQPVQPPPGRTPPRWRERLRVWWMARLPVDDALTLTQHNVYIVPTGAGCAYAATLLVLLLASINYQLSLGYLLTFLLAGAGMAALHLTHANLRGLQLHLRPPSPVFAGEAAELPVTLTSGSRRPRYGIGLRLHATPAGWVWTDVPAQAQGQAALSVRLTRRGWHALPPLVVETRFPLGVFRAWSVWRPAARALAYPRPEEVPPPLPAGTGGTEQPGLRRTADTGETEGVRAYRRGDPLKTVLWKKAAKNDELVSRDTAVPLARHVWLDYAATSAGDVEARLSRLAAWVLAAEARGLAYGLRLPGVDIEPAHGEAHRRRCLTALAEWG